MLNRFQLHADLLQFRFLLRLRADFPNYEKFTCYKRSSVNFRHKMELERGKGGHFGDKRFKSGDSGNVD